MIKERKLQLSQNAAKIFILMKRTKTKTKKRIN